jgi:hypothetical protein
MRRLPTACAALLLTACGGHEVVVCGPCAGPGYVLTGLPSGLHQLRVMVCLPGQACRTTALREPLYLDDQQYLALPSGARWEAYDGRSLEVTVRSGPARWQGTGTLDYRAGDGSPCDCGSLLAEVPLTRATSG